MGIHWATCTCEVSGRARGPILWFPWQLQGICSSCGVCGIFYLNNTSSLCATLLMLCHQCISTFRHCTSFRILIIILQTKFKEMPSIVEPSSLGFSWRCSQVEIFLIGLPRRFVLRVNVHSIGGNVYTCYSIESPPILCFVWVMTIACFHSHLHLYYTFFFF